MIISRSIKSLQKQIKSLKLRNNKISLVPTMGSLHEGHLSLIKKAKGKKRIVIVSIFINPTQFGANEDFAKYPKNTSRDIKLLKKISTDIVFLPHNKDILKYKTSKLKQPKFPVEKILCGKSRPRYFPGVGKIIIKLFDVIKPDYAYFGEKDYQQLYFIKQLVKSLKFHTKIIPGKTIRDSSGIALSSRNLYLNDAQKLIAKNIIVILRKTKRELLRNWNPLKILNQNKKILINIGVSKIDYFELRSENFNKNIPKDRKCRLFIAVFIGSTRLIDNIKIN